MLADAHAYGGRKRWTLRAAWAGDGSAPLVARVLAARGLLGTADAAAFLHPSLRGLHEPSLIPDLDRAAERLLSAVRGREPIAIYGDYDVDGITGTAILYHMIRALDPAADVRTYVPHRLLEGYGLNAAAVRELAAAGARVIVSVDCGITAFEPAREARAAGVDLIITDHHNPPGPGEPLPAAFAVVHPRRADSVYPFGDLSGAGVAYKLAWRLATLDAGASRVAPERRRLLIDMLAFAALGAIADVVPLVGENRIIARFGLDRVRSSPVPGLRALVEASGLADGRVDEQHVGFWLAPRLNACGRMGHAREAVELFTTASGGRAAEIAAALTRLNGQRREVERRIADQAGDAAERAGMTSPDRRAIVLAHEDWHAGVVGIVCSRLVERFGRPTILMHRDGDECHGSGRSVGGFSLHAALARCAKHLVGFGGHDMAAGLRLRADRLDGFADAFIADANGQLSADDLRSSLTIDCDAQPDELTTDAARELDGMAPFGQGNPRPRIRLCGVRLAADASPFGSTGRHVSLIVRRGGGVMRVVGWNWAERAAGLPAGAALDLVVSPRVSEWNGTASVEPTLEDFAHSWE